MYIIVIGWLYITVLMAATEKTLVAGLLSLIFYGLAPVALFIWIFGSPARRRASARKRLPQQTPPESTPASTHMVVSELLSDVDRSNTKQDQ